jgi:hypothetical protein
LRKAADRLSLRCRKGARPSALQPFGQADETLATEDDAVVRPAGEGQAEMVEPVIQRLAGDRHPEVVQIGEAPFQAGAWTAALEQPKNGRMVRYRDV